VLGTVTHPYGSQFGTVALPVASGRSVLRSAPF